MNVRIGKSKAMGTVNVPPSKSMAHRYIICAAFSEGTSHIDNLDYSQDILATLDCAEKLGAVIERGETSVTITGVDLNNIPDRVSFPCRESGSTMRFFMGIALCLGIEAEFYGSETLRSRPFGVYEEICRNNNIIFDRKDDYIYINGKLECGLYKVAGNISSQFITGLIFGLILLNGESSIELIPPVESRSYLDLTLKAIRDFGAEVTWKNENIIDIPAGADYTSRDISVEGDYSNAAFLEAFNAIGGNVTPMGLADDSLQGDRVYRDFFPELVKGFAEIDISDCPDLGPILFAVAAANNGGVFTGTRRLKMKESDRGTVMCLELSKLGVISEIEDNKITIGAINNMAPVDVIC